MSQENDRIRNIEEVKARAMAKYTSLRALTKREKPIQALEIPTRLMPYLLNICPRSEGPLYEKLVLVSLVKILGPIIDQDLVRQQVPVKGGKADIELPFCPEMLPDYPHWAPWHRQYNIQAIIAEVKNLKKKASHEDVNQLYGYVKGNKKGKLAFLVSRNGFTRSALKTLAGHTDDSYLLLPLEHSELKELLKLSTESSVKVMRYLQ